MMIDVGRGHDTATINLGSWEIAISRICDAAESADKTSPVSALLAFSVRVRHLCASWTW